MTDMALPLEINFRGLQGTPALRTNIEQHAEKLFQFAPNITRCHVVLEPAQHRHHRGNLYQVHIRVNLPGAELDVGTRTPGEAHAHEDAYVAIRDAFKAMRRRLQDFRAQQQGKVKRHAP